MERVMDSIDKATGVTWGALVTQQVIYGLGMIILASLALLGLYVILKRVTKGKQEYSGTYKGKKLKWVYINEEEK